MNGRQCCIPGVINPCYSRMWPSVPFAYSYEAAPRDVFLDYEGALVPIQAMPYSYNYDLREERKCFLARSLFDLVNAHHNIALTDTSFISWYIHLSPEDRRIIQDEGGIERFLKTHPALELSCNRIYVTCDSAMTTNRFMPQGQSMLGISNSEQGVKMLTNYAQENLPELYYTNTSNGPQNKPCMKVYRPNVAVNLHNSLASQQMASSSGSMPVCPRSVPGSFEFLSQHRAEELQTKSSFFCNTELERSRQSGMSEHQIQGSEWKNVENDSIESAPLKLLNSPLSPENSKKEPSQDYVAYDNNKTVDNDDREASIGSGEQSRDINSLMEEDKSIVPSDDQKASDETLAPNKNLVEAGTSVHESCTEERGTSPMPCTSTCDVMVGTELAQHVSAFTQTEDPKSRDKHVNTEVCMSDLDYVAVEFIRLKKAQEELKHKEKVTSSSCKKGNGCECFQRAQRAEISVLALQYSMCRQHCLSLYYSTAGGQHVSPPDGEMNQHWPKEPSPNILDVLKKLQYDYNELRDKLLEGIPLDQLRPLSVDCEKITTSASYVPAQIIANMHGSVLPRHPQTPLGDGRLGDKCEDPDKRSFTQCQKDAKQVKPKNSKARRAVALVPQASCKELTTDEAWYDAKEDFEEATAGPGQNQEDLASQSSSEETNSSVRHPFILTRSLTKSEVMLTYHGSEISASASDKRFSGSKPAEALVRESDGFSIEAVSGSQAQSPTSVSGSESSQDATE